MNLGTNTYGPDIVATVDRWWLIVCVRENSYVCVGGLCDVRVRFDYGTTMNVTGCVRCEAWKGFEDLPLQQTHTMTPADRWRWQRSAVT